MHYGNYSNYSRISKMTKNQHENLIFGFLKATVGDINKMIKTLNSRKATGPNGISIKIIKTARNVIDPHSENIMIKGLDTNKFQENANNALVMPLYKKNDAQKKFKIIDLAVL